MRWYKCGEEAETIIPFTFIVVLLTTNNAIHPNLNNLTNLSVTICQFSQTLFKLIEGQKEKGKLSNSCVHSAEHKAEVGKGVLFLGVLTL